MNEMKMGMRIEPISQTRKQEKNIKSEEIKKKATWYISSIKQAEKSTLNEIPGWEDFNAIAAAKNQLAIILRDLIGSAGNMNPETNPDFVDFNGFKKEDYLALVDEIEQMAKKEGLIETV